MNRLILITLALILPATSFAYCFEDAGRDYHIDPDLLLAIAIRESRLNAHAFNGSNNDGTSDSSLMQINSTNLAVLHKFGITKKRLYSEPCMSVYTGGWVLAGFIKQYGYTWEAVGAYNAGNGKKRGSLRKKYSDEIRSIYTVIKMQRQELSSQRAHAQTYPSLSHETKPVQFLPKKGKE
ncbi:invasion protein IagB [Serratia ficaria]|uniref:lytic transglycosylase domain-containing protein n=1 Tax=Serratia ficaria TaxID=61651 RepID=UPI0021841378|nr:lytic transglycosylase domain-containing protein [Serratia ficaria]CAI2533764.1 invasion protein IagB [Serratia ficaria]